MRKDLFCWKWRLFGKIRCCVKKCLFALDIEVIWISIKRANSEYPYKISYSGINLPIFLGYWAVSLWYLLAYWENDGFHFYPNKVTRRYSQWQTEVFCCMIEYPRKYTCSEFISCTRTLEFLNQCTFHGGLAKTNTFFFYKKHFPVAASVHINIMRLNEDLELTKFFIRLHVI